MNNEIIGSQAGQTMVVMQPTRRTARVHCVVEGIRALQGHEKIVAVLTGCANHMDLLSGICPERLMQGGKSSLVFEAAVKGESATGYFYLLRCGFMPNDLQQAAHKHWLRIYVEKQKGKFTLYEGDVTDQVPCNTPIGAVMPDFDICLKVPSEVPDTGNGESMFEPEVDDWEDVETVLPLTRT